MKLSNGEIDNEAKKVLWSLQNNKRNDEQRDAFKPTGKKPKKNGLKYVTVVLFALFVVSFLLVQFQKEVVTVCITNEFCIDSEYDKWLYILYVFVTNIILVFGIYFAYKLGINLAKIIKK